MSNKEFLGFLNFFIFFNIAFDVAKHTRTPLESVNMLMGIFFFLLVLTYFRPFHVTLSLGSFEIK